MSIAGYEAFVCACFFAYKTLCAALHTASVGRLYMVAAMFVYTARKKKKKNDKNVLERERKKNEQKVGMLLQKRADTRGVGISNMRKSI